MFLKKFLVVVGCGLSLSLCASQDSVKNGINISAFDNSIKLQIPSFSYQNYPMRGKTSPDGIEQSIESPIKNHFSTAYFTPVKGQPIFFIPTDSVRRMQDFQCDETTPLSKAYAKRLEQKKSETSTSCYQRLMSVFCCFR